MNESKKRFVDRLLAADAPSPESRRRYEEEVRAMLEKSLTPRQRTGHLVAAVLLALLALDIFGASLGAFSLPAPVMEIGKYLGAVLTITAFALLAVAGLFFRAYWQGVVSRRTIRGWAAGVGVTYVGLLGWLFLLMAQYIPERLQEDVRILGLVLLVYAAVAWMRHRIAQAEGRMAEKLLEIELRVAKLGEALEARPRSPDPTSPQEPPSR
jgi:hypothetical protein